MDNFDELAAHWDEQPQRMERAKAVAAAIMDRVPGLAALHGFEYGCGTGLLSLQLQPFMKEITLGDNSPGMLAVLEGKIREANLSNMHPLRIDLTSDPEPGVRFDLIYTMMTLHHIADTMQILTAFYRLLTPPGYLCIADLDEEDGSFHDADFSGHHGFNREDLARLLTKSGFGNVHSQTCFQNVHRDETGNEKLYPMFVMTCQKI